MHRKLITLTALVLFSLVLAACGGASTPAAAPATEAAPVATEAATEEATEAAATEAAPAATDATTTTEAAGAAAPVAAGLRTFVIVPAESTASYHVDEEFLADALDKLGIQAGKTKVTGSTQAIEGQLQLNLADLTQALGDNTFTVQMNTLKTDQDRRDNWIRENGPNFNQYPVATFKATGIEGAPAAYTEGQEASFKLVGDLTVREVTKPATFDVTATLNGNTLTGTAITQANLSDFGIDPPNFANTLTVADPFSIEVQFTAREQ
jgi:polyisoprenoid-binding protein YceI